jgi:hypothetical protein
MMDLAIGKFMKEQEKGKAARLHNADKGGSHSTDIYKGALPIPLAFKSWNHALFLHPFSPASMRKNLRNKHGRPPYQPFAR